MQYLQEEINSTLKELVAKVIIQKEELILKKLNEYFFSQRQPPNLKVSMVDFTVEDVSKESQRRFPRIQRVFDNSDQSEHFYWNDGSYLGFRIISFYPTPIELPNLQDNKYTVKAGFRYK